MKSPDIGLVFDDLQAAYTEKMIGWVPFYEDAMHSALPDIDGPNQIIHALELGAGNGNLAALIIEKYPDIALTLVDASANMLSSCANRFKNYEGIEYHAGFMQEVVLPPAKFDLITASYSLHHLEDPEKKMMIERIHQWLAPHGYFSYNDLFIDPDLDTYQDLLVYWKNFVVSGVGENEWLDLYDHHKKYDHPCSLAKVTEWLQEAGFGAVQIILRDKYWLNIIATH